MPCIHACSLSAKETQRNVLLGSQLILAVFDCIFDSWDEGEWKIKYLEASRKE